MSRKKKYTKTQKVKKNKKFFTDGLTRKKYDEIHHIGEMCLDRRNAVSEYFFNNFWYYMNLEGNKEFKKNSFVTDMSNMYETIGTYIDQGLYRLVFTHYDERLQLMEKFMTFKKRTFIKFKLFEKDCKAGKAGELDKCVYKEESTPLSQVLSFLARHCEWNVVDWIEEYLLSDIKAELLVPGKEKELENENNKRQFYWTVLEYVDKFGLKRLLEIANRRKEMATKKYNSKPIHYKTLSFDGYCCYNYSGSESGIFIGYNKKFKSVIDAFISLTLPGCRCHKRYDLPVKYAKDYHLPISYYKEHQKKYIFFKIQFDEWNKELIINLSVDVDEKIVDATGMPMGGDINIKHSMTEFSDGHSIDYDREIINDFIATKKRCDAAQKLNKGKENYHLGKRNQRRMKAAQRKMKASNQEKIVKACKHLKKSGSGHLILEDLQKTFKSTRRKDKDGNNYNMVMSAVNMSSLKDEYKHIGKNHGVAVSTVQSEYTSIMCPVCGCISKSNRKTQEEFHCVHCGHTDNADHNAAVNIKDRVSVVVLRNRLLKYNGVDGTFSPKKLSHSKVKEILESYSTDKMKRFDENRSSLSCSLIPESENVNDVT